MVRHAFTDASLTDDEVAEWHRDLLDGLSYVPDLCYLGGYRGSAHPWLSSYNIRVGRKKAVPADRVAKELQHFFDSLEYQVAKITDDLVTGQSLQQSEILKVVALAAWTHGEWVRIHPFANANGRTARLLANWVLARFRLSPVIRLRPRPDSPYVRAAAASMDGQHDQMARWILDVLESSLST